MADVARLVAGVSGASLTREQMNKVATRRSSLVREAVEHGTSEFCPVANQEVLMPRSRVCVWCGTDHSLRSRLTNRQLESMRRLAHGGTRKQIAHDLEVSETTVANDWRDCRHRLNARTTTQAVVMLVREGSV